jgi:hypothetical protein
MLPQTPLLQELAALRYSDGSPVLQDHALVGAEIIRDVLVELGRMDDVAFQELGYDKWSEDNQRAAKNDGYIYQGVMDVLRRRAPPVGRFQVTKAATVTTSRVPSTPEQDAAPRVGTDTSADASADAAVSKSVPGGAATWRTWTTRDGKYRVEAKFLKHASGTVTLGKKDGTTVDVKLELLCADDQDFVTQQK